MIFVDTSAWYAAIVPSDQDHLLASSWVAANSERLLTTDYIIDETLTLLRACGERLRAISLGDQFFHSDLTEIYLLTESDLRQAWDVFRSFDDKGWSFTDCTSKVVMELLGITEAFTFDHHFKQFGQVIVVP